MKLLELFNKTSVEWEWEEQGSGGGSAVFAIGDAFYRTTMQGIVPSGQPNGAKDECLDVAFEGMRFDDDTGEGMSTGNVDSGGYQYQVLSTVFDIVEDWFSKNGIMPIFCEATQKRARIYTAVLKRKGWRVEIPHRGYSNRIFAYPPGYQPKQPS